MPVKVGKFNLKIMNKNFFKVFVVLAVLVSLSSCYTMTATIGNGPKDGVEVKKSNHYLIGGLVPISTANVKEMAGEVKDYEIKVTHTFVDGFLMVLTGGLYTPTTTIVTK